MPSDSFDPTSDAAAAVREALDQLKFALDDHLLRAQQREGEQDPAVLDAYDRLHQAAQLYDDVLFDAFDEVTPFTLVESSPAAPVEVGLDVPARLSLLYRADVEVVDEAKLFSRAATLRRAQNPADPDDALEHHIGAALATLVDSYGPDALGERAEEFGLREAGYTQWIVDEIGGELANDPFSGISETALLVRDDEIYE